MQYRWFRAFGGFKVPRLPGVARYGDRPRPNIFRGLAVGVIAMATLLAMEVEAGAIGRGDITAGTAPTAGIAGTYRFHCNPDSGSFVSNLESHISIRPPVDFGTQVLPLAQRTVSDVRQVFHHDPSCPVHYRVTDECLGGDMQEMSRYGSLFPGHPLKEASGASGANGLDGGAGAPDARTAVIQLTSVEEKWFCVCGIGRHQHSLNAHVNADNATFGFWIRDFHFMGKEKVPLLANALELGVFPFTCRERTGIMGSDALTPKGEAFRPRHTEIPVNTEG